MRLEASPKAEVAVVSSDVHEGDHESRFEPEVMRRPERRRPVM